MLHPTVQTSQTACESVIQELAATELLSGLELQLLDRLVKLEQSRLQQRWESPIPYRLQDLLGLGFDAVSIRILVYSRFLVSFETTGTLADDSLLALNAAVLFNEKITSADAKTVAPLKAEAAPVAGTQAPKQPVDDIPHWDLESRTLEFRGTIVKTFRCPAQNQEAILCAFEEEGWPARISDPLAPVDAIAAKQRLHDAIRSLNRNQTKKMLRFKGDGRGEGILWEVC